MYNINIKPENGVWTTRSSGPSQGLSVFVISNIHINSKTNQFTQYLQSNFSFIAHFRIGPAHLSCIVNRIGLVDVRCIGISSGIYQNIKNVSFATNWKIIILHIKDYYDFLRQNGADLTYKIVSKIKNSWQKMF